MESRRGSRVRIRKRSTLIPWKRACSNWRRFRQTQFLHRGSCFERSIYLEVHGRFKYPDHIWKNLPFFKTNVDASAPLKALVDPEIVTNFQNKGHSWYVWLRFRTRELKTFCETFAPLIRFSHNVFLVTEFIVVLRLRLPIIFTDNENG